MRRIIFCFIAFAGLSLTAAERPNILWIMTDDHATEAYGAYGGRLAGLKPTPALDRLAADGVRFTNVFCTNSICTPSRATPLTGQYSHVNGVRTLEDPLPANRQVLTKLIRDAGYETAVIGKWHLHEEPAYFDFYCVLPGQGSYFNPVFHRKDRGAWPQNEFRFAGYDSVYVDDAVTRLSIEWLKGRDRQKPFFLFHHFKGPHDNFENAERHDFLYEDVTIPEPASLRDKQLRGAQTAEGAGTSVGKRNARRNMGHHMFVDAGLSEDDYLRTSYQRYLKKYLRTVRGVDENVAKLLAHLEASGELENTVIFYTSDQGFLLGEHDLIDKRWMYEPSLRMPFVVRQPKRANAGRVSEALVENIDFAPTLLDFAGVTPPSSMQGKSLRPLLAGEPPADWRTSTYYRYWMHGAHHDVPAHYGVRTAEHKLIFFYGLPLDAKGALAKVTPPTWELYDLRRDPEERKNVYSDPSYAPIEARLKRELLDAKARIGDEDEKYPQLMAVRRAAGL